jgi:hypothetical protein
LYYALNDVTTGIEAAGCQAVEAFSGFAGVYVEAAERHGL